MSESISINSNDRANVLSALADMHRGYMTRDLCDEWAQSAVRLADALGNDDADAWDVLREAARQKHATRP